MHARIRYGPEADVLAGIGGRLTPEELGAIRNYGRTVLSFSRRVRNLPDEEEFDPLMRELEIIYKQDELEGGSGLGAEGTEGIVIPANRMIEVVNPQMVDIQILRQLSYGMLELAGAKGYVHGENGAHFIDHSTCPDGIYLGFYNPTTDSIEE